MGFSIDLKEYLPFWNQLSPSEQSYLLEQTRPVKFTKGSSIHNGQNDCIGVLLIKSGALRCYIVSEEGKEITLYRMNCGDICILSASCILNTITFDVNIDAEQDSELFIINSGAFSKLSQSNIYVENFSYKLATERFSDVMWAFEQILFMSFDKRLAIFLYDELTKNNSDTIKLTHEQIAKYMGSAREVVSRMLKYFSKEGIVELSRGGIKIINKNKLKELIK